MIKINWMIGLGNLPRIILEEELDFLPREECDFLFKNGMFYHIQENGLVRYYAHSGADKNEGGFGGANITINYQGKPKVLKGPWSGRASYLNQSLPVHLQVADITLLNRRGPQPTGILVSELVKRWDQDAYLLRSLEARENGSITASLAPDCIRKPDGSRMDKAHKYQIFKEPTNVESN